MDNKGVVHIIWRYRGKIIGVTGYLKDKVFNVGNAWVRK